jgi:hypothetical protein
VSDLLESPEPQHRERPRLRVIADMTTALAGVGDSYRAPDGVFYSLIDEAADEREPDTDAVLDEARLFDHRPGIDDGDSVCVQDRGAFLTRAGRGEHPQAAGCGVWPGVMSPHS